MDDQNRWLQRLKENPGHSDWYINRFKEMAAEGRDLHGEARLLDAMARRGAHILDAGCGPGRVAGELARRGHTTLGVDLDPVLIREAALQFPDSDWLVEDLSEFQNPTEAPFDLIALAGNVMAFLAPSTRQTVLTRMREALAPEGRIVVGFSLSHQYDPADYFSDLKGAGLRVVNELGTWDLHPFTEASDFLITVLEPTNE